MGPAPGHGGNEQPGGRPERGNWAPGLGEECPPDSQPDFLETELRPWPPDSHLCPPLCCALLINLNQNSLALSSI
jgi:hypothetical protein